jgi:two-component system, OmpR family, KDP operon response regulator KdpE
MTHQTRVLIVNERDSTQAGLAPLLSSQGYDVEQATSGEAALDAFELTPPGLMILDLRLPDMEGSEICRRVRRRFDVPIIVLSARGHDAEKIAALDEGADDYITKPFAPDDLLARVDAAIRRVHDGAESETARRLELPDLTIDFDHHRVVRGREEIHMDAHEFELLAYLARHANRVLTYRTILLANPAVHTTSHLWERISRLRRKIEADPFRPRHLLSEPWVGYRFVDGLR